jgi:DNA invertase Pin-like site-specific DNA recombinase
MMKTIKNSTQRDLNPSEAQQKKSSSEDKNVRACIYARTARTGQDSKQAQQIEDCSQYIAQKGWTLSGLFLDEGVSGRAVEKPELSRMMELAAKGSFDVVVVSTIDRISRSIKELFEVVSILSDFRIAIRSTQEAENAMLSSHNYRFEKR